ncbi:MAG: hypothetical protein ABIK65_05485 [Candidatus Eisenbacteria bacterium]
MKRTTWAAVFAILVGTGGGSAGPIVEVDLSGVVGDGADRDTVRVGEEIAVDLWFVGGEPLVAWGITLCSPGGALEFVDAAYRMPGAWTNETPESRSPGCVYLGAANRFFGPLAPPFLAVTVTYRAAGEALAELVVDEQNSGWFARSFVTGTVDGSIGASVAIAPPLPPASTWGTVKGLFR